jgi:hypothetical protein
VTTNVNNDLVCLLDLAKECYELKLELLANVVVVHSAIRFGL